MSMCGSLPTGLPHRHGKAAAASEAVGCTSTWRGPGSRWPQTWQTYIRISPPLHRPQEEEELRLNPPPPALYCSAPGPVKGATGINTTTSSHFGLTRGDFTACVCVTHTSQ